MDEIINKALENSTATLLELVITVIVPYAMVLLRSWVKAKIAAIEDKGLREGVEYAFDRLNHTAETVVAELKQTYVQHGEDGKVVNPIDSQREGINRLYSRLDPGAKNTLKRLYPDEKQLARILKGKIESKVKALPRC